MRLSSLILFIIIIILIVSFFIAKSMNLDLSNSKDRKILVKETFSWLKNVGKNIKEIVGLAIKQDWLPEVVKVNKTKEVLEMKLN